MDPKERAAYLREVLSYHSDRYYNQDSPEIADAEYDALMRELRALEASDPTLITPDSITQRVGGAAKREAGVLIPHRVPMLSMQDLFSREEVSRFVEDCMEKLGEGTSFLVETKIDGLSLALRYEKGRLVTAITRGDGRSFGEDVTENAKVIRDIPHRLKHGPDYLEVRGEVYMKSAAFEMVNEQQELLGKKPFANPRNCAAGTLRQLDSSITKERDLSFFCFNIQELKGKELYTHEEGYRYLRQLGHRVMDHYFTCSNAEEVWDAITRIGELRGSLSYEIDGAVVKVNNLSRRSELKDTAKNAGYQVAYKYPPERKETKLLDIELSVGRTGKITPTAVLEPIRLCGTTVSRAILHNQDFIDKLGICIGSTLVIEKSGEVIPKCVGEVKEKRPPGATTFVMPSVCPVCGSAAVREEDTADLRCKNLGCPAQLARLMMYFVGRDAMDIKGFGAAYIRKLIEAGYIQDSADIFTLYQHRDALIEQGLIGKEKNTDKLLEAIEKAKHNAPAKLLTGLGIPNVGKSAALALMAQLGSLGALAESEEDTLTAIPDIGPTTARCIVDFFSQPKNRQLLDKLSAAGVNMRQEIQTDRTFDLPLSGKTFVITGTLPGVTREEAAAYIEKNGGKVRGSVSAKTSYLLAGDEAGSKLAKARDLQVPVLDWPELLRILGGSGREPE